MDRHNKGEGEVKSNICWGKNALFFGRKKILSKPIKPVQTRFFSKNIILAVKYLAMAWRLRPAGGCLSQYCGTP